MNQIERRELTRAMIRLANGDRAAFDTVYEVIWPVIRRFSAQMIGDHSMAEDLAQQTLFKAFSRVSTFDRNADALNWILGIAANECRTHLRKTRRGSGLTVPLDQASEVPSGALTPAEEVEIGDLRSGVMAVLGDLKPHELETVVAVIYESQRPIISPAAFRKRWQRAVQRAREIWNQRHERGS